MKLTRQNVMALLYVLLWFRAVLPPATPALRLREGRVAGHDIVSSFSSADKTSIIGTPIRVIFQDKDGVIWFGGYYGLCSYDEKQNKWTNHSDGLGKSSIQWVPNIGQDSLGRIWIEYRIDSALA